MSEAKRILNEMLVNHPEYLCDNCVNFMPDGLFRTDEPIPGSMACTLCHTNIATIACSWEDEEEISSPFNNLDDNNRRGKEIDDFMQRGEW